MDKRLKKKLVAKDKWIRGLYLVLFLFVVWVVKFFIWIIALLQFMLVLFTDNPNERLREFGGNLSVYVSQIFRYLSYTSDDPPYPFASWPHFEGPPKRKK